MDANQVYYNTDFTRIDQAWLSRHPLVKIVASPTTGLDHLDLLACEAAGVKVVSLQGETEFLDGITSVSEHVFGLLLSLARNYKSNDREKGIIISGKTIGVIGGGGRIGRHITERAEAFDMRVLIHDKKYPF